MTKDYENMSLFEQIKAGLEDSVAYSHGQLTLKTTELPEPPPQMHPVDVTRLRKGFRMSQAVFAAALNVSPKTVQSWEQGEREPSDVALRMLQVLEQDPNVIRVIFTGAHHGTSLHAKKSGVMRRFVFRRKSGGVVGGKAYRINGTPRRPRVAALRRHPVAAKSRKP